MSDAKMSRIKHQLDGINFYVDSDIESIKKFFTENLNGFYDAFNPVVLTLKGR